MDVVDEAEMTLIRKVLLRYPGITAVEAVGDHVVAYGLSYEALSALPRWVNFRAVQVELHSDRSDLYAGLRRM
jgi:hypothetical protein